jgi:hypothetical protein
LITGTAKVEKRDGSIFITVVWNAEVDRKNGGGWSVPGNRTNLAARLACAIDNQMAFTIKGIETDINGKTYVSWNSNVRGRYMDFDLKKIGF